jgi:hypothetical protein
MADLALYISGGLTLLVAIAQGWLGAVKSVEPVQAAPAAKRILHAIMFLSAVYWFVAGGLLLATPTLFAGGVRYWVVIGCALMLGSGGIGNIWAMRGRHFGGYALLVISALAVLGR